MEFSSLSPSTKEGAWKGDGEGPVQPLTRCDVGTLSRRG